MRTLLTFLVGLFVLGCNSSSTSSSVNKPKTDLQKDNLKGDIILVIQENKLTFYDNGMLSKVYEQNESLSRIIEYGYINHKLATQKYYGKGFKSDISYNYTKEGELISSTEKLHFDQFDGTPISTYYKFDEDGNEILDSLNDITWVKYDYEGDNLKSIYFNYLKKREIYRSGVLDSLLSFDSANNILSVTTFEYSYDPQGNWIQQKSFVDGKEDKVVNRQIFYKGQDISEYEKKYNDFVATIKSSDKNFQSSNQSDKNSGSTNVIVDGGSNNSSSNYNKPMERQKQWINCFHCHGTGKNECSACGGKGTTECRACWGKGNIWLIATQEYKTCSGCGGKGEKKCSGCYGIGNKGRCIYCEGKGQVQE